jgi:DNA-binding CsgD family transcriptional regulator
MWNDGESVPLLVAVDDAQWADEPSLHFLAHLALRIDDLPIMMILTVRSGEPASSGHVLRRLRDSRAAQVVSLAPLSETAVETMVRAALGEDVDGLPAACFRATGGNPFYLRELLRALGETPRRPEQVGQVAPATVLRSVVVRLARLGEDASALARAAAVLGDSAPLRLTAALAGIGELAAEAAADSLARGRILQPGEPLRFAHPLIASALEADMGAFERARKHRHAAELLRSEAAPVERVAAHLMFARPEGDGQVVAVLEEAAGRASANGAPAAAARLLERALKEPPDPEREPDLLLSCAKAETRAGSPAASMRLERALEQIKAPDRRAQALAELGTIAHLQGDFMRAAEFAARGQSELPAGHPLRPHLLGIELSAAALRPDLVGGLEERLAPILANARDGQPPSDPRLLALVAGWIGVSDPPNLVRSLAEAAIALDPLIDDSPGLSIGWVAAALEWIDELELSERWLSDAIEVADRRGAVIAGSTALYNRARVRLFRGRLHAAVEDGERALELYRHGWTGSPWSTPVLAAAHAAMGDLDAAREAISLGQQMGPEAPDHGRVLEAEARLRLAEGDAAGALESARAVGEFLSRFDREQPRLWEWRRLAALAAHRLGDDAQAVELLEPDLRALRAIGPGRQLGEALTAAGLATGGRAGLELLSEAVTALESSPARLQRTEALVALGGARRRAGQRTAAKEALYRALELAGGMGARTLEREARDELVRLGLRPRRTAQTGVASLTPSEQQVAGLAADGLTTPQIAANLHITRNTVDTHLRHIYQKLGLAGRHELSDALGREIVPVR